MRNKIDQSMKVLDHLLDNDSRTFEKIEFDKKCLYLFLKIYVKQLVLHIYITLHSVQFFPTQKSSTTRTVLPSGEYSSISRDSFGCNTVGEAL